MTRGFYIGRFQPYHNGHHAMVETIADEVDELVLGIGSAGSSHSEHDPFTAGERVMMLTRAVDDLDLQTYVVPIEDLNRNSVWVSHVQSMCPSFEVAYSNNPLVVRLFEEAGIEVRESPMFDRGRLEGTEIRERMVEGEDWRSLVPDAVVDTVEEVDGVRRIQAVAQTDVGRRWTASGEAIDGGSGPEGNEAGHTGDGGGGDQTSHTGDGSDGP